MHRLSRITTITITGAILSASIIHSLASTAKLTSNKAEPTPAQIEFFEKNIRPVLATECYSCHSVEKSKGGLALDHRDGLRKGGDSGKAVLPGKGSKSLLIRAITHADPDADLHMPKDGAKLEDSVVRHFIDWINMGVPDPRDHPPTKDELAQATSWETVLKRRQQWWSFQPITKPPVPAVKDAAWSDHPVDRFILAKLEQNGLQPAEHADKRTLLRRLSFVLTGLPPTLDGIHEFLNDTGPDAYERCVDRLLRSPHFGERWARHWMDWVRYTETHGSEGDPTIPFVSQYRDYLIRALNEDIPYDQLLREHIAGDLLPQPRINPQLGLNESALATAHLRMVFHGFAPTDALDEKVRFTDDQINVFSQAFLGLTVSCARCHDHKFDAISQADYYALFGIFGSTRPGIISIDPPDQLYLHHDNLDALKQEIRNATAEDWLKAIPDVNLLQASGMATKNSSVLHPWFLAHKDLTNSAAGNFNEAWSRRVEEWEKHADDLETHRTRSYHKRWDLADPDVYSSWFTYGNGLDKHPAKAGEFVVAFEGDKVIRRILPGSAASGLLSDKHRAVIASEKVRLNGSHTLWLRVAGDGKAVSRYVVQHYPRSGTVYPVSTVDGGQWRWMKYNLNYWDGDDIHIELTTANDTPILVKNQNRSWFALREAVLVKKGTPQPPGNPLEFLGPLFDVAKDSPPNSFADLANCYRRALTNAVEAWAAGSTTDSQALFLDNCLQTGLLPNSVDTLPSAKKLLADYRKVEAAVPVPKRAPGILESVGIDQPLFVRGSHKKPGAPVPRRFLEAIDPSPYKTRLSGRLQLAEDLIRPDNPLTARVMANRIWHYVFEGGIAPTTDNFGRLGIKPSHPELLDYLASRFVENNWSIKDAIRFLLTTKTWQLHSSASPRAQRVDPDNRLLSHANVRRLEAEAIRDSLLAVSGQLDRTQFGSGINANSDALRRSVYIRIRRNSLDALLETFDAPVPFATKGSRDVTTVPAQSLTLLNDRFIIELAKRWGHLIQNTPGLVHPIARVQTMFQTALGRLPTDAELRSARSFLATLHKQYRALAKQRGNLESRLAKLTKERHDLLHPVEERLRTERDADPKTSTGPTPIAHWDFEKGFEDQIGELHGKGQREAKVEDGALVLNGRSYVSTPPLAVTLREKTLEALVKLDDLEQRGGGVVSIQSLDGAVFDAIVFAEHLPHRWYAGSEGRTRGKDFGGPDETAAESEPVHIVIAYDANGTIRGYRNGKPYGKGYRKTSLHTFTVSQSMILFGLRHGSPGGNRLLKGRLLDAKLYNRALTEDEIAAAASSVKDYVTHEELLAELSAEQKAELERIEAERSRLIDELAALGEPVPEGQRWADFAHAMFNLKEFIYLN